MSEVARRVSLTQPAPLQIDSTEPEVIQAALERTPGRAIVNSVNLEAGREKLDRVVPLARAHGAALIALTIDEVGMAKTAERKLEVARRIKELACDEHGLDPELLIFDALTFTLTTGDEEWRPSAVETIEGIRRIKAELGPGSRPRSASPTSPSGSRRRHARCSTRSSCITASRPGSTWRWSTRTTSRPTARSPTTSASSPTTWSTTAARTRSSASSPTSSRRGPRTRPRRRTRPRGWSPSRRCTGTSCAARRRGSRTRIDASVEKIGAVPTLNEVLLPAMKEVGDKFGAGELILPFVLQSAEVMKRAVAQLENYLDRIEGHTKGKVVIATVFGDVHDIGKSLVNTILTNNGYTVVDLGKQVPVETIIDAAVEHEADAIGLSALLVSTSKQMPACIQELHQRGLEFPVLIGGAAINRDFGRRVLYPHGKESDEVYEPGVFYCKDAFAGLDTIDALVDEAARESLVAKIRDEAGELRRRPVAEDTGPADDRRLGPLGGRNRQPDPRAAVLGRARGRGRPGRGLSRTSTVTCCSSSTGAVAARRGRSGAGSSRATTATRASPPKLERMWGEQDYLRPRVRIGYFPCNSDGNELVVFDPADPRARARAAGLPAPAPPRPDLPRRLLSPARDGARRRGPAGGHGRTRGHRADRAARARWRVRRAALRPRARRAGRRGPGRVAARAGRGASSGSSPTRVGATRGAIRPAPTSPSTRRSSACSDSRRSGSRSRAATRSSPSSRRRQSSPTIRRRSTSG